MGICTEQDTVGLVRTSTFSLPGHRLTAWEVWHAYGPNVIEEAVENGVAVLMETEDATEVGLLGYWKELGVSASVVAEVTGLSEEEVSAGEAHPRELPIPSLESIAFALGTGRKAIVLQGRLWTSLADWLID